MAPKNEPVKTFDELSREQLVIYAIELNQLIETERQLRLELESRNRELQERVREIKALNQLFHKHLDERLVVTGAFSKILEGVRENEKTAHELAQNGGAVHVPEVVDLPILDS